MSRCRGWWPRSGPNIGLLKSFGYSNTTIALHYAKFALVFGVLGALLGALRRPLGGRLWSGPSTPGCIASRTSGSARAFSVYAQRHA